MTETDRIQSLERQLQDAQKRMDELQDQLVRAELEQWRGRIDDLEIRLHLASLEVRDRVEPIVAKLRDTWLDARASVSDTAGLTSEVVGRLRQGIEDATKEIRSSVSDARATLER